MTYIGTSAFDGCSSLKHLSIPESVTQIGAFAFGGCSSLKTLTILRSDTQIDDRAFDGCSSLLSLTVPDCLRQMFPDFRAFNVSKNACPRLTVKAPPAKRRRSDHGSV